MRKLLENQYYNLFLWVPILLAFGAATYFSMTYEFHLPHPGIISGFIAIIIFCSLLFLKLPSVLRGILCFVFGFVYATAFTYALNTPQIKYALHDAQITATVTDIDYAADKVRVYLRTPCDNVGIVRDCTANIRVSIADGAPVPNIGDNIRATVNLYHPSGADAAGAFDYARWAYFNKISATGFMSDYSVMSAMTKGGINNIRYYLHNKSGSFLTDTLVLGYKNAVSDSDKTIWTATGIGHVWSISGFHIALVSGWLFTIFFCIFRLVAPITRRIPARIPALVCTWAGLLFYVLISGGDVATWRAFFMCTLVFVAFIIGRDAISLRNVCLVCCLIILMNPHYVMQAGFQLSFSAVFGLVWIYETTRNKTPNNKVLRYTMAAVLTTLTATVFTAVFVVAHFNALPLYGLIGNLFLLPIFSFAIMPLIMLGCLTAIFGINAPIVLAHRIYDFCFGIAQNIAELPNATISFPYIPNIAICIITIGFAALIFVRPIKVKINYLLCGVFVACGITIIALQSRPVFYTTTDNELIGVVGPDDKLLFNKSRASNHFFAFNTWKQINGEPLNTDNIRMKHNHGLYIYDNGKIKLAYMQKFIPLQNNIGELCADTNLDYIVSYLDISAPNCHARILRGGFMLYNSGRIVITPSNRPWHIRH